VPTPPKRRSKVVGAPGTTTGSIARASTTPHIKEIIKKSTKLRNITKKSIPTRINTLCNKYTGYLRKYLLILRTKLFSNYTDMNLITNLHKMLNSFIQSSLKQYKQGMLHNYVDKKYT